MPDLTKDTAKHGLPELFQQLLKYITFIKNQTVQLFMTLYKHMTELNSPEHLNEISVGQTQLVQNCVDRIEKFSRGGSPCNMLLIGPDGIGKSHALSTILHELTKSKNIVSVKLGEEYTISNLDDLCKRILAVIGETYSGDDVITHCRRTLSELKHNSKIVIIFVENLESMFSQINEDLGKLRSILQSDRTMCIVGGSRRHFNSITSPDEPFYRGFDIEKLRSLTDDQILELIQKRLVLAQKPHLVESLEKYPSYIRDTMSLVNGNPRLAHILADIIIRQDSLYDLKINELLDCMSPQYIERTNNLSGQQRKIYDHIVLLGKSVSPTDLTQKLKIAKPVVITQLRRLRKKGLLENVKLANKKENRYGITDHRYGLWRRMRHKSKLEK